MYCTSKIHDKSLFYSISCVVLILIDITYWKLGFFSSSKESMTLSGKLFRNELRGSLDRFHTNVRLKSEGDFSPEDIFSIKYCPIMKKDTKHLLTMHMKVE